VTTTATALPPDVDRYAAQVAHEVADELGEQLVGVWLVGSAALRDLDPRRSDVDVQAVSTGHLPPARLRRLAARIEHPRLPCPARGLEFVLYAAGDLAVPDGPRFSLNLNGGPRMAHHLALDPADDPRFWFVVDTAIARQSGVSLLGPPPAAVFPELPVRRVATAVLEALDFHAGLGDPDQTLLSACRAWAWASDRVWRSKGDSARWAARRLPDPSAVERALRRRDGGDGAAPTAAEVDEVLTAARAALDRLAES
jgi:hypothetical protein